MLCVSLGGNSCLSISPEIRADCGNRAADKDGIIRKSSCIEAGCCWDTSVEGVPWCFLAPKDTGVIEIKVEEVDVEASEDESRFGFFGLQNRNVKPVNQTKNQLLGHPTSSPLANLLPGFAQPKQQKSVLAENINDACKSNRIVDFMREMGFDNPEKYGKIPCIADGKGALGTNRPAWGWSKKYKDTANNHQQFLKDNPTQKLGMEI